MGEKAVAGDAGGVVRGTGTMGVQPDLVEAARARRGCGEDSGGQRLSPAPLADPEEAARLLDAHEDYRVLRRLRPRPLSGRRPLRDGERLAVVLDTETTGLDHRRDEVIELGMVAIAHDADGRITAAMDAWGGLREPSVPIPAEVTRLTGITADMVAGHAIDLAAVGAFIAGADIVISHNARFDRPFCERLAPAFGDLRWGCSIKDIEWAALGAQGTKLEYLLAHAGMFHQAHRATDDCRALLEVLCTPIANGGSPLGHLLAAASRDIIRVWAVNAPYEAKDLLRSRGYRWSDGSDGRPRSWWIELAEGAVPQERAFLRQEVYGWDAEPIMQRLTAVDRYKAP